MTKAKRESLPPSTNVCETMMLPITLCIPCGESLLPTCIPATVLVSYQAFYGSFTIFIWFRLHNVLVFSAFSPALLFLLLSTFPSLGHLWCVSCFCHYRAEWQGYSRACPAVLLCLKFMFVTPETFVFLQWITLICTYLPFATRSSIYNCKKQHSMSNITKTS